MSLFNKKKDVRELRLPEAPMMFPELPSEDMHEGSMSTFPGLQPISMSSLPPLPPMNMQSISPEAKMQMPSTNFMNKETMFPKTEMAKFNEPIFIKIDKYREALANFELIKKRLQETSSLLDKIKDTRKREEEELNSWAQEMESIKLKVSAIDKKMFGTLE